MDVVVVVIIIITEIFSLCWIESLYHIRCGGGRLMSSMDHFSWTTLGGQVAG